MNTLSNLLQFLADKHASGVIPTESQTISFWTRLLNEGQEYCADRLQIEKQDDITTSSYEVALPSDFLSIISLVRKESGEQLKLINASHSENAPAGFFWITGDDVTGRTLHTPSDETFTIHYVINATPMVNNTDVCIIPDPYAVVCYAYAKLRQSETDPIGDAGAHLAECERRLDKIIDQRVANSGGYGFTIL